MASVDRRISSIVAHMPEVVAAVRVERDRVAHIAEGLFEPHDNPGGHQITTSDGESDAFLNLDGPAPLAVEFGHWTPNHTRFVEGLHILSRAIGEASA